VEERNYWRKCSTCKTEIAFGAIYQKCNVSTCRKNIYCSVDCWDVHNPVMNHKSSWAEEERAPQKGEENSVRTPQRRIVPSKPTGNKTIPSGDFPMDILIVASKLKAYIKAKHDMNTSGNVMEALSHIIRLEADKACEKARADGRKTLMDRDF
jgi:hypothetical protein